VAPHAAAVIQVTPIYLGSCLPFGLTCRHECRL
jgi:hypothetical protein